MRLWNRVALTALLLSTIVAVPSIASVGAAVITLHTDPAAPYCAESPGGTVHVSWSIQHTTTTRYVYYVILDPTRTIRYQEQTYPGTTGLTIGRSWAVPGGLSDGQYIARVEYWSFEAGLESFAESSFAICGQGGTLCVTKMRDSNCNGALDPSDVPVAGWTICMTTTGVPPDCRLTGTDGRVCWTGLAAGSYTVYESPVSGWDPVGPSTYTVDVTDGQVTNVTFLNVFTTDCNGACCFHNGSCTITVRDVCVSQGGTFQGPGSSCTPNPCVQPTGSCCLHNGSCTVTLQAACSGIWTMDGTCAPNPCVQPSGSCCAHDGTCTVTLQAACTGIWTMDGTCTPNPCNQPTGSCCHSDGTCTVTIQTACTGIWTMDGVCDPNPCIQPSGACCVTCRCVVTTHAGCDAQGGAWMGPGTGCVPNPCSGPPSACCLPDHSCIYVDQCQCEDQGGTFMPGLTCDPNPCLPPTGACCYTNGSCVVTTQSDCTGTWQGPGTVCDPNPCPQPTGACCFSSGECRVLTRDQCASQSGTYRGDGTGCDPNPCAPTPTERRTWGQIKHQYR